MPASPPSSPPGVFVDKQTSLLLTPPSRDDRSVVGQRPRCHYQDEYLEEDMHSLLSDWMEHDTQGSEISSDEESVSNSNINGGDIGRAAAASSSKKKKKKKGWRKLQWRPKSSSTSTSTPKRKTSKKGTPPLPPSSSTPRKYYHRPPTPGPSTPTKTRQINGVVIKSQPHSNNSSSAASVTTMRSNASSTNMSTATQKHSNRATVGYSPTQASILASSVAGSVSGGSSVKSSTPPMARIRRRRQQNNSKSSGSNSAFENQAEKQNDASAVGPSSLPPRSPHSSSSPRRNSKSKILASPFRSRSKSPSPKKKTNNALNESMETQNAVYNSNQEDPNINTLHSPLRPRSLMKDEVTHRGPNILETLSSESNSLILAEGETDEEDENNTSSDERTHVTVENRRFKVTKNYNDTTAGATATGATTATATGALHGNETLGGAMKELDRVCIPLTGGAQQMMQNTCGETGATIVGEVGAACMSELAEVGVACNNKLGSPTSVGGFPGSGGGIDGGGDNANSGEAICGSTSLPFDECNHYKRHTTKAAKDPSNNNDGSDDGDNNLLSGGDEETVATINSNERRPGPIDIDTCTRHLTPTERRHLRAMHQLGYAHLRNNEYPQSIEIFTEILRGQKERHGKRSLQAAVAMHNLGVVCMRCGQYRDTVRLTDLAARIRVERLGKDHLDVAMSLAQQGVALMELEEYALALASFCEALRIREKAWSGDNDENNDGVNHPLIVRLLNNIGCALFEMDELDEARKTFENALKMQRELMKANKGGKGPAVDDDDPFEVDPKNAYHTPLSIALTLTNLGSIHLRMNDFDKSLVCYEEAVLIQESVLGENHKIVINTQESIDFVVQSKEEQDEQIKSQSNSRGVQGVKIDRIAGILPYVSYEESKRIYSKVHDGISNAIDVVSSNSKRCNQPCATDDETY